MHIIYVLSPLLESRDSLISSILIQLRSLPFSQLDKSSKIHICEKLCSLIYFEVTIQSDYFEFLEDF